MSNSNMNTSFPLQDMRNKLNEYLGKSEDKGKAFIVKTLEKTNDAWNTIEELQFLLHGNFTRYEPILQFFELLGISRSQAFQSIFRGFKSELEELIEQLDESNLLLMIRETISLMGFNELKSIPISILKKMKQIPKQYLRVIIERNYIKDLPLPLKRIVWEYDTSKFVEGLLPLCSIENNETSEQMDKTIKILQEYILSSDILLKAFFNNCVDQFISNTSHIYLSTILSTYMYKLDPKMSKSPENSKLIDFAKLLESFRKLGINEVSSLKNIQNGLLTIISNVLTFEDRQFQKQLEMYNSKIVSVRPEILDEALLALQKLDRGKIFLNPVSDDIAPNYSKKISNPMNLSTMKNKIKSGQYKTLDDFNRDVLLIVENCRKYNGPESPYWGTATQFGAQWEQKRKQLLAQPFGEPQVNAQAEIVKAKKETIEPVVKSQPKPEIKLETSHNVLDLGVLNQILLKAWKFLSENDEEKVFASKVTDIIAPGYSKIIKKPMDLSLMKRKISNNQYTSFDQFEEDFNLMISNCMLFNGSPSFYFTYSEDLQNEWLSKKKTFLSEYQRKINPNEIRSTKKETKVYKDDDSDDDSFSAPIVRNKNSNESKRIKKVKRFDDDSDSGESFSEPILPQKNDLTLKLNLSEISSKSNKLTDQEKEILLKSLKCFSDLDNEKIFAYPPDPKELPDYFRKISRPMDLSTIKNKISNNSYKHFSDIDEDFKLILSNCAEYNKTNYFGKYGKTIENKWKDKKQSFLDQFNQIKNKEQKIEPMLNVNTTQIDFNKNHLSLLKRLNPIERVFFFGLDFVRNLDIHGVFLDRVSDDIANYYKIITCPMYLNLIKTNIFNHKYKTLVEFNKDVMQIFANCKKFNPKGEEVHEYAKLIETEWRIFQTEILCKLAEKIVENSKDLENDTYDIASLFFVNNSKEAFNDFDQMDYLNINEYNYESLNKLLSLSYRFLLTLDEKRIFFEPVTERIAPGYSKCVKNPICLRDIKVKIDSKKYIKIDELHQDVLLMVKNCFLYNSSSSAVSVTAIKLNTNWQIFFHLVLLKFPLLSEDLAGYDLITPMEAEIVPTKPAPTKPIPKRPLDSDQSETQPEKKVKIEQPPQIPVSKPEEIVVEDIFLEEELCDSDLDSNSRKGLDHLGNLIQIPKILTLDEIIAKFGEYSPSSMKDVDRYHMQMMKFVIEYLTSIDSKKFFSRPNNNYPEITNPMDFQVMGLMVDRKNCTRVKDLEKHIRLIIKNAFLLSSQPLPFLTGQILNYAWFMIRKNILAYFSRDSKLAVIIPKENIGNSIELLSDSLKQSSELKPVPQNTQDQAKAEIPIKQEADKSQETVSVSKQNSIAPTNSQVNLNKVEPSAPSKEERPEPSISLNALLKIKPNLIQMTQKPDLSEFPELITTSTISAAVLMLTEPLFVNQLLKFLAQYSKKYWNEGINSSNFNLGSFTLPNEDPVFRFLCQFIQISLSKDLNIRSPESNLVRIYIPNLLIKVFSSIELQEVQSDEAMDIEASSTEKITSPQHFIDNLLQEYPLQPESFLDQRKVSLFLLSFYETLQQLPELSRSIKR